MSLLFLPFEPFACIAVVASEDDGYRSSLVKGNHATFQADVLSCHQHADPEGYRHLMVCTFGDV